MASRVDDRTEIAREGLAMPREVRMIIFSQEELQAALFNNWMRSDKPMPRGHVERLQLNDGDCGATLHYRPRPDEELREWHVSQTEVAASLIRYAIQKSIPLPRAAKKTLFRDHSGVVLLFDLNQRSWQGQPPDTSIDATHVARAVAG